MVKSVAALAGLILLGALGIAQLIGLDDVLYKALGLDEKKFKW